MFAVGRYIQQGVYTVAAPFHPFGGAVDIVVVKQEDGTFKSSPWYVKFGKFQGVLKRREKVVDVAVNDVSVPFHMYLDATGEAYFLKDEEPDFEDTVFSPPSAVSSGDEGSTGQLAIEAAPAEVETFIKLVDATGQEDFDGGDEKPADTEMRDEERKSSLVLDQENPASENLVVSDIDLRKPNPDPSSTAQFSDTSSTSNGQLAADGGDAVDIPKLNSQKLLTNITQLRTSKGVTRPRSPIEGGAAVHVLLNQAAGVNHSSHAEFVSSLLANAALSALDKAATTPADGFPESFQSMVDELPSSLEYLESVSKDKDVESKIKTTYFTSPSSGPLPSVHFITDTTMSGLQDSSSLLCSTKNLKAVKFDHHQSLPHYLATQYPIMRRAESDVGHYQGSSGSSAVPSLMIASADGIIFLETPTSETSAMLLSLGTQAEAEATHEAHVLQGTEDEELPDNSVLTSMSELCRQENDDAGNSGVEKSYDEQGLPMDGESRNGTSDILGLTRNTDVVSRIKHEQGSGTNLRTELDDDAVDSAFPADIEGLGDGKGAGTETKDNLLQETGGSLPEICELDRVCDEDVLAPTELLDKVDLEAKNPPPQTCIEASTPKSPASPTGFNVNSKEDSSAFELQESVMEKRRRVSDAEEGQESPEKRPRTSGLLGGDEKSREVMEESLVVAPLLEGSSITTDEAGSSSSRTDIAEQELAWREAISKAAAALRVAPYSTGSPHRFLNRKGRPDLLSSPSKRFEPQGLSLKSSSPDVADRTSNLSAQDSSASDQAERRSWGWFGWRGGSAPPKVKPNQDKKKQLNDSKGAAGKLNAPLDMKYNKVGWENGDKLTNSCDEEEPSSEIASGPNGVDSVLQETSRGSSLDVERSEASSIDAVTSDANSAPRMLKNSMSSKTKHRQDKNTSSSRRSSTEVQEQESVSAETPSSKDSKRNQDRGAGIIQRRSILGIVFRGREQLSTGANEQATSAPTMALDRETSLKRAEIVTDLLETSWGYGRKGVKSGSVSPNPMAAVVKIPDYKKKSSVEVEEPSCLEVTGALERTGEEERQEVNDDMISDQSMVSASALKEGGGDSNQASDVGINGVVYKHHLEGSVLGGTHSDMLQGRAASDDFDCSTINLNISNNGLAGENQVEDITKEKMKLDIKCDEIQEQSSKREVVPHVGSICITSDQDLMDQVDATKARVSSSGRSQDGKTLSVDCPSQNDGVPPAQRKKEIRFAASLDCVSSRDCSSVELPADNSVVNQPADLCNIVSERTSNSLRILPVHNGSLVLLATTNSVDDFNSIVDPTMDTQDISNEINNTGVEDIGDAILKNKCSEECVQLLPAVGSAGSMSIVSTIPSILLEPTSPPALESRETSSNTGKEQEVVESTSLCVDITDTSVAQEKVDRGREAENEQSMCREQNLSEDEHDNPYDDVGEISRKSIYYDANTSDDEGQEDLDKILGVNDKDLLSRSKSDPVSIPVVVENEVFNDIFTAARDRPLSESLPEGRSQYVDEEHEQKSVSRSVGSDPLPQIRTPIAGQDNSEAVGQSPGVEGSKESGSEGVVGSPLSSTRSGDVSAGEEAVNSDNGYERAVETGIELSLCRHLLKDQMGIEEADKAFASTKISFDDFRDSGMAILKNNELVVRVGGKYFPWSVAAPILLGVLAFGKFVLPQKEGAILVERPESPPGNKPPVGALVPTASGGWKLWPFPLRRPRTPDHNIVSNSAVAQDALLAATETAVASAFVDDLLSENGYYNKCPRKNRVRTIIPSSEMLSQMNLREGSNVITFTFFTRMLGRQQVDARIYLWKYDTRIVISDVDGTITKSDVLGQVMPLVGKDWTQSGVARLFSAIKDNGYELLFLSARAISQAYLTRQFLFNVKQDGETLPAGPVVISPDGLFPSLYREVIRRAPHEFKIACLQDIRSLFPKDCNPFYAGFGNRDTDEISYLKVGIPKGKIFIINPKGEVAVNNRPEVRTYTSLHKMVNDMFPAQTLHEQEDFNSWNFWKLPFIDIDDELKSASASGSKRS